MGFRTGIALLAATMIAACSGSDGFRQSDSNEISIDNDQLFFKRPTAGKDDSDVAVVEVRSSGDAPLTINRVYLAGDMEPCDLVTLGKTIYEPLDELEEVCSYLIVERDEFPKTLATGEFVQIKMVFHRNPELGPLTGEPPTGTLIIESDADNEQDAVLEVQLSVEAETPKIQATPTVISFPPDSAADADVVVQNVGTGTLLVDDIQLRLTTEPARDEAGTVVDEFVLDPEGDLPWAIEEGDAPRLTVRYTPFDAVADSAQIIIKSTDPEKPSLIVTVTSQPLKGLLRVDPPVATFELGPGDFETTVDFTFQNNGLKPVSVYDMVIVQPGNDYDFTGDAARSFELYPGNLAEGVKVKYHPANPDAPTDGVLYISTDADNAEPKPAELADVIIGEKIIRVPLVHDVTSVPATLGFSSLSLDLSATEPGASSTQTLTLTNTGGAPLSISAIRLSTADDAALAGMATDPEFKITTGGGATTLAPAATHDVTVELTRTPADISQHFGAIIIESDAEGSPHVVTLFADAPPPPAEN
jgi:hypothetical protein